MAVKKDKATVEAPVAEEKVLTFSKAQIVASKKYSKYQDYLKGNLVDGEMYTMQAVDDLLKSMKG